MSWSPSLRFEIVELFDEAQRLREHETAVLDVRPEVSFLVRKMPKRSASELTPGLSALLDVLEEDQRVSRAGRVLNLASHQIRQQCDSLVRRGLIKLRRAENKRGSLLAVLMLDRETG